MWMTSFDHPVSHCNSYVLQTLGYCVIVFVWLDPGGEQDNGVEEATSDHQRSAKTSNEKFICFNIIVLSWLGLALCDNHHTTTVYNNCRCLFPIKIPRGWV